MTGARQTPSAGLRTVDPELALLLNQTVDDSSITRSWFITGSQRIRSFRLKSIGIAGGTRYRALPRSTSQHARPIAAFPICLRSVLLWNRTLTFNSEPEVRAVTGVDRARVMLNSRTATAAFQSRSQRDCCRLDTELMQRMRPLRSCS